MSLNAAELDATGFKVLTTNYTTQRSTADSKHIPIIAYWTPGNGCSYCNTFESKVYGNEGFKTWMKETPYIWTYSNEEQHTPGQNEAYKAAKSGCLGKFPFVLLHWKVSDNFEINVNFSGREATLPMPGSNLVEQFKNVINFIFGSYVPTAPQ